MILINTKNKKEIWYDEFTRYLYKNKEDDLKNGTFKDYDEYLKYVKEIDSFETIYYNITKACNMNCSYCYSSHENKHISLTENKIIVDKIRKLNCTSISLIGGEPMCHPQFKEILEDIKSIEDIKEIVIITNGTQFNKNDMDYLKDPRIIVQISLDDVNEDENSKTRGKGQLPKVLDILPDLKHNNINVGVMKVITRGSMKSAKNFFDFFYEKNISAGFFIVKKVDSKLKPTVQELRDLLDYLCNNYNMKVVQALEHIKFADNLMIGNEGFPITHCGAGITSLSIHPDGNVYPCVKSYSKFDYITNIFLDESIDKIKLNRQRIIKQDLVDSKEKCVECDIKYFCGGGCRAEEQIKNKVCEYNCEYFELALEYYAEKYLEE